MTEQEMKQQRTAICLAYLEEALNNLKNAKCYLTSLQDIENDEDMGYFNQLYNEIDKELTIIGGGL